MNASISFLELNISSFYGANTDVLIRDGMIYYRRYSSPVIKEFIAWQKIKVIEAATSEILLPLISNWAKEYNSDVCDGTSWEMKIQTGNKKMRSHGHHNFPPRWNEFIRCLAEMCDEDFTQLETVEGS